MITRSPELASLLALAAAACACSSAESGTLGGGDGSMPSAGEPVQMGSPGTNQQMAPVDDGFKPTPAQLQMYLQYIGPALLGRTLSDAELADIQKPDFDVKPMLNGWFGEEGFAEAVRGLMEMRLSASGKLGDVDYNLAGYIVRHVVQNRMPWSTVVTSPTCYDQNDMAIPCDTGAPYSAGVLTTRGYLAGNEGRFNLSRAHTMLKTFMCRDYPHEDALQAHVEPTRLRVMFRATSAEDQKVAEAAGGFGNGLACYSCHGQFSLHAQPFVKFDKMGNYVADATGEQNPAAQLGESTNGTFASHWEDPALAKMESSMWFGTEVANLAEAGAVVGKHDKFRECTLQQLLDLAIGLNPAYDTGIKGLKVDPAFLSEIAGAVKTESPDPSIQDLAVALLSDPRVIATTINGMKR